MGADIILTEVALVAGHDRAAGGQLADDAPDPGRGQVNASQFMFTRDVGDAAIRQVRPQAVRFSA
jgi:hypothetical protein